MSKAKRADAEPGPAPASANDPPVAAAPQTATERQATLREMVRDCHARLTEARAALNGMALTNAAGRRQARATIADLELEIADYAAAVDALEPAAKAEFATVLHAARIKRFERAREVLASREAHCTNADTLVAQLAELLTEATQEEAEARELTGCWDFVTGLRESTTVGGSLAEAVLANLVRLGVLPIEQLPDAYNTDVVPLASVQPMQALARALTANILNRWPAAAPEPQGVPAAPVSYVEWLTQSRAVKEAPQSFAAAERTGTPAPVQTFGPAPKSVPIFGADIDEVALRNSAA